MSVPQDSRVSGHIRLAKREHSSSWYVKWRIGERQFQKRLGPAWAEKGRPQTGYYTKRTAEAALAAILTDARRGTLVGAGPTAGVTFRDAAEEWVRYMELDESKGSRRPCSDTAASSRARFSPSSATSRSSA